MIPLKLRISGFLSYRDPVELDFDGFDLACISGQNGAGKSSLLDAMTWSLFGEARGKDKDALINLQSKTAEVSLTFSYENNTYRIQRSLTRGKNTMLEFQIAETRNSTSDNSTSDNSILDNSETRRSNIESSNIVNWRPLTEKSTRETQSRINQTLRLDYDTFVNASFFLQGKADEFTQKKASERKAVLGSILGLEIWETYKERATERRKEIEREVGNIDVRLAEIDEELGQEKPRKARLTELGAELTRMKEARKTQETVLETIKQANKALERQWEMVDKLTTQVVRGTNVLNALAARLTERESERGHYAQIVAHAEDVEQSHANWQAARIELEKWNTLAQKFSEQEKGRQEPLAKIGAEQARLEQERDALQRRKSEILEKQNRLVQLESEAAVVQKALEELVRKLKVRAELERSQTIITRFRGQAKLRQPPLTEIHSEMARLEQEFKTLEKQRESVEIQKQALKTLQVELDEAQEQLTQSESKLIRRSELEQEAKGKKERQFELKSGNERLKLEMETLDERINKLAKVAGAVCPLCGQPLSLQERQRLMENLHSEGKSKGDEFRKNKAELESIAREIMVLEKEIAGFGRVEKDHLFYVTAVTKISERAKTNLQTVADWETKSAPRLVEIQALLKNESFSLSARKQLARIDRELNAIGKALGVKASLGKSIFDVVEEKVLEIESQLNAIKGLEKQHIQQSTRAAQLGEQINALHGAIEDWNKNEQPRKVEIDEMLAKGNFSLEERIRLAKLDDHLKSLGYDAAIHETIRQAEQVGRATESTLRELESARAVLISLERELADLQSQVQTQQDELDALKADSEAAQKALDELSAKTPNIREAESALFKLQEQENIKHQEVGGARQLVDVLSTLRVRKEVLTAEREETQRIIAQHKTLERAFGKDGVPALLIEQALPQIETKANDLLDRLSDGQMSIRFATMAEYKDKKRDDLKETLDIQISDGAGLRDYEMYSGGEAFRVNFAIRLALSEVLAQRKGARLQTLVIDEGFGSQDAQGRQRLIEAINLVKPDFAKILVITHLDELKDAFPTRIEVEKTERGSSVRVI